jgi:uncharacterized protein DUF6600/FecR-like protein
MRLALILLPLVLFAAPPRYARLGEFQGAVEVQLTAADAWIPAERNLPLLESTWVRTGPASRAEIELEDGNAWRLGPDSQMEIADYKRLSTGQRITMLWLEHGIAYFTGITEGNDSLILAVPGAQVTIGRGTRVRLEVAEHSSLIAIIEGMVRFSSPAAEMDLREGQTTRIEPANPARFFLNREVPPMELDRWSEERDKLLTSSTSAAHVLQRYGVVDLDAAGEWIQTDEFGTVWKPKTEEGWLPFRSGRWRWYDSLGYTWVSSEPWGWLPYHYGRWLRKENLGWIWAPSRNGIFKPGDVYWLRGARIAGWGPLAPGEQWPSPDNHQPQQYLTANTVWGAFPADAILIEPGAPSITPKDPLSVSAFAVALPSPAFVPSKLESVRPLLRAGRTRVIPRVDGVTFSTASSYPPALAPAPTVIITEPAPAPAPPPAAPDVIYGPPPVLAPVPILIVNPPGNPDYGRRQKPQPAPLPASSNSPSNSTSNSTSNTSQTQPTSTPVATTPPALPPSPGRSIAGPKPVAVPNVGRMPRIERPPVDSSRTPPPPPVASPRPQPRGDAPKPEKERVPANQREKRFRDSGEAQLLKDVEKNVAALNYAQALATLDIWARRYRSSDFSSERAYFYMQAYTGLNQPAKVVDTGRPLLAKDLGAVFEDPAQIIGVLYLASLNLQKLQQPTPEQMATGKQAAYSLLQYVPAYFTAQNKPPAVTADDWMRARTDLESLARHTIAMGERAGVRN